MKANKSIVNVLKEGKKRLILDLCYVNKHIYKANKIWGFETYGTIFESMWVHVYMIKHIYKPYQKFSGFSWEVGDGGRGLLFFKN